MVDLLARWIYHLINTHCHHHPYLLFLSWYRSRASSQTLPVVTDRPSYNIWIINDLAVHDAISVRIHFGLSLFECLVDWGNFEVINAMTTNLVRNVSGLIANFFEMDIATMVPFVLDHQDDFNRFGMSVGQLECDIAQLYRNKQCREHQQMGQQTHYSV